MPLFWPSGWTSDDWRHSLDDISWSDNLKSTRKKDIRNAFLKFIDMRLTNAIVGYHFDINPQIVKAKDLVGFLRLDVYNTRGVMCLGEAWFLTDFSHERSYSLSFPLAPASNKKLPYHQKKVRTCLLSRMPGKSFCVFLSTLKEWWCFVGWKD